MAEAQARVQRGERVTLAPATVHLRLTVCVVLLLSGFWQAGRPDTKEYSQPVTPHEMTHAVHTRQDDARSMWL